MRKLIDINELLKHSHDVTLLNGAKHRCIDATVIHEIPTVDAESVIRCKDCKYYSCGTIEGKHLCMSVKYRFTPTTEDEWCSRAERKEDDKTDRW